MYKLHVCGKATNHRISRKYVNMCPFCAYRAQFFRHHNSDKMPNNKWILVARNARRENIVHIFYLNGKCIVLHEDEESRKH